MKRSAAAVFRCRHRALGVALMLPFLLGAAAAAPGDLALELVADGFETPVQVIGDPDDASRLLVVELAGVIRLVVDGVPQKRVFLNIRSRVSDGGGEDEEHGLFSVAFDPRWPRKRFIYVNYTNNDGDTVIARFKVNRRGSKARPGSEKQLLKVVQPRPWHNGGQIQVGPDDHLYVGMGDGGDDLDSGAAAQDLGTLLGKMLRYRIANRLKVPKDNPTLPGVGRTAIWAIGLRNPWRFSFDRKTGDLLIADVGEATREEIDYQAADSEGGINYGWPIREGSLPFNNAVAAATTPLVGPIHEYPHGLGQSVTGGYVYRGSAIKGLRGYYVYGDWASSRIWAFKLRKGRARKKMELSGQLLNGDGETPMVSSFGEDADGELYLCDFATGEIYKIVAAE